MATPAGERARFLGRRLLAVILDSLLYTSAMLPIMYLAFGATLSPPASDRLLLAVFDDLLPAVLLVFCWVRWGATPGKFLMGLRVVDDRTGGPITLGQGVARLLGYVIGMLALFLGFAWAIWDKRSRGWHDYMARTRVVRESGYESCSLEQLMEDRS